MNGLEETYQDQIEFRSVDVNTPEGEKAFRAYGLPGHPGYVLLDTAEEVLWVGFGEQNRENIEAQLQIALAK